MHTHAHANTHTHAHAHANTHMHMHTARVTHRALDKDEAVLAQLADELMEVDSRILVTVLQRSHDSIKGNERTCAPNASRAVHNHRALGTNLLHFLSDQVPEKTGEGNSDSMRMAPKKKKKRR